MSKKNIVYGLFMILIIITVGIAGCVSGQPRGCTFEAKLCPDGSYVGRDSNNNCQFTPCPGEGAQLANPASVYCVEQGGTFKPIETEAGTAGYCEFPDGNVCEEWAFFRSNGTTCNSPS